MLIQNAIEYFLSYKSEKSLYKDRWIKYLNIMLVFIGFTWLTVSSYNLFIGDFKLFASSMLCSLMFLFTSLIIHIVNWFYNKIFYKESMKDTFMKEASPYIDQATQAVKHLKDKESPILIALSIVACYFIYMGYSKSKNN